MRARMSMLICEDCGSILTDNEREFYTSRCEGCARAAWEALQQWKAGAPDPTLEAALYQNDKPTVH